ncbi:hypothetical protein [Flavobacterium tistrianum]|uniref:hypothetical protein n=1 Tax=Flavobacterium tistrianum TaxID=1685414 RepID=UPI000DAE7853|nr:hypothetical protein [Flavobacterium tistrianum]KAF2338546.1 hypothetical protein DMB71_21240 [Flavobacterium tistrianum]
MKKIFPLIIVLLLFSCNSKNDNQVKNKKEVIIDIKKIVGKNREEIDKILGKSDKVEPFSESSTPCKNIPCEKAFYQKDKFEIIFIDGKSDWITINDLSQYDFSEDNIEILGLPYSVPDFNNPRDLIRWKNIEGINEINIFNNGSDKISYAYIKVKTE